MNNYEFCARWAKRFGGKALDYGCGRGETVGLMKNLGLDAWGCDVYPRQETPEAIRPYIRIMENERIPFDDHTFDAIISNFVFEHVRNLDLTLEEISRVLKPGGKFLCLFPDKGIWVEGHCGIPFASWFESNSKVRPRYIWVMRMLGFGTRVKGRSAKEYCEQTSKYLDEKTHYRALEFIENRYENFFGSIKHIETEWLDARKSGRMLLSFVAKLPFSGLIVQKLAGNAIVASEPIHRTLLGGKEPSKYIKVVKTHNDVLVSSERVPVDDPRFFKAKPGASDLS